MSNDFTADGHERWTKARSKTRRDEIAAKYAGDIDSVGFLGRIRLWFKIELEYLRGVKREAKSSPKILW